MSKVLILYTSIGLGHKAIAKNFEKYLTEANFEVYSRDILQVEKGKFSEFFSALYLKIIKSVPFVWEWLYNSSFINFVLQKVRIPIAALNAQNTRNLLKDISPDIVITTQITASTVMAYLKRKGEFTGKLFVAFSDYHFQPSWAVPGADGYLVNIEEQKKELIKLGVEEKTIKIVGMTLAPRDQVNILSVRERFKIAPDSKVVLLAAGSLGIYDPKNIINEILKIKNLNIIAVCGKNLILEKELKQVYSEDERVKVLGFYSPMEDLYSVSSIFVTKPGGLSVAEALLYRLPLFINHALPGQETHNIKYLKDRNLIVDLRGHSVIEIRQSIESELLSGRQANLMKTNENVDSLIETGYPGNRIKSAISELVER